jgi:UDP:flavonoid glycosyltransferase YjiC (YdhE family)
MCLPAVADQFFWGHRVAAVGAGPPPLPVSRLRSDRLAPRLVALTAPGYAGRAAEIAAALADEDGAAAAVAAVERFLGRARRRQGG